MFPVPLRKRFAPPANNRKPKIAPALAGYLQNWPQYGRRTEDQYHERFSLQPTPS